ncbi:MAG: hypothetical protein JWN40_3225 [Phycisphaerales bacterium]|nr:hypothetical protein [Phycisphaerales bacterium]
MRRLLRILLTAATFVSLLLFALTAGLWLRSHWAYDALGWDDGGVVKSVTVLHGGVFFSADEIEGRPDREGVNYLNGDAGPAAAYENAGAFGFSRNHYGGGKLGVPVSDIVRVPLYPLVVTLAILPSIGYIRITRARRARSRRRRGLCPSCGYDLRATPGQCPECGAIPPAKEARLPKPGG